MYMLNESIMVGLTKVQGYHSYVLIFLRHTCTQWISRSGTRARIGVMTLGILSQALLQQYSHVTAYFQSAFSDHFLHYQFVLHQPQLENT